MYVCKGVCIMCAREGVCVGNVHIYAKACAIQQPITPEGPVIPFFGGKGVRLFFVAWIYVLCIRTDKRTG